jgi:hypothetical protein
MGLHGCYQAATTNIFARAEHPPFNRRERKERREGRSGRSSLRSLRSLRFQIHGFDKPKAKGMISVYRGCYAR